MSKSPKPGGSHAAHAAGRAGVQQQQGSHAGLHPQVPPQGAFNPVGEMKPLPIPSESRVDVPSLPGGSPRVP